MARPTRSFRRRRWVRRGKREYIWSMVNVYADHVFSGGECEAFPIVVRDDWARDPSRGNTVEKGAVLLRVTGDIRVGSRDTGTGFYSANGAHCTWGIGRFDEDDATILDLLVGNFFGEDWMQVRTGTCWPVWEDVSGSGAAVLSPVPYVTFPAVDIRVKRKLTSEDEIRFVHGSVGFNGVPDETGETLWHYQFRSLIQLP